MKKILISLILTVALLLGSCRDFLDINKDPNNPTSATSEMLISSGILATAAELGGEMQIVGEIFAQHYTQNATSNQYTAIRDYTVDGAFRNTMWTNPYARSLEDLTLAMNQGAKSEEANVQLVSKVMIAFNFHILTDWYGNIPFTEAIKGSEFFAPKYDDSKTVVYPGIIKLLDEAIALQEQASSEAQLGKADFLYSGDIDSWVKFAKTLKLKLLMRDFQANTTAIEALLTEGDLLVDDAGVIGHFADEFNKSNPLYEMDRRTNNTPNNIVATSAAVAFLTKNNDPRIAASYETYTGVFGGFEYGTTSNKDIYPIGSVISRARLTATDGVYFLSEVESYFLQSEAYARLGNPGAAKIWYDKAVKASFARSQGLYNAYSAMDASNADLKKGIADFVEGFQASELSGEDYIATGGVYEFKGGSLEEMLKQILTQKWIASIRFQGWDAFFDINRTGIPARVNMLVSNPAFVAGDITTNTFGTSAIPNNGYVKRIMYPNASILNNPNADKVESVTTELWWQKK